MTPDRRKFTLKCRAIYQDASVFELWENADTGWHCGTLTVSTQSLNQFLALWQGDIDWRDQLINYNKFVTMDLTEEAKPMSQGSAPRYYVEHRESGWWIFDRTFDRVPMAIFQSQDAARDNCEALNRGLTETVAPNGRWTEKEGA